MEDIRCGSAIEAVMRPSASRGIAKPTPKFLHDERTSLPKRATHAQMGNFAEAARLYEESLRLNPRQVGALYGLGFLHFQDAQYGEAERLMSQAVKINPGMAEAYFIQGCSLHRLSRIEDALAAFDRAVTLKPSFI
jgi:tetratricopeptide (TPR) repeat protein